ncbi:Uncharacterised protein [Mycobacteroides abscessus subsp. abscessus]|nr:Uncharacterised protein [Mycobacteroides abscessus subsp. abscessus]
MWASARSRHACSTLLANVFDLSKDDRMPARPSRAHCGTGVPADSARQISVTNRSPSLRKGAVTCA